MFQILLIDNYDSFTYNLVHYFEKLNCKVEVCKNDYLPSSFDEFDAVVISPGPGLPEEAGDLMPFLDAYVGQIPILGVCLGMQALALQLNGTLVNQKRVKHGVPEVINTEQGVLFEITGRRTVGLYHSWAVEPKGDFDITAKSQSDIVMAIENTSKQCFGVQFHPESILTENGIEVLENFLKFCSTKNETI